MGGSWERIIQTVKEAIFAIIKDQILLDFKMLTLFSEAENIVNNSPLTYLSEDQEDLEARTPTHFFIGRNFYNNCLVNDSCKRMYAAERSGTKFTYYQIFLETLVS